MVKIGKVYHLHFGKDTYISFKVIAIDYNNETAELENINCHYVGADKYYNIPLNKLYKKRKIRNW